MTTTKATRVSFPAPTLRGRVFIDTSGSMQGFFGRTTGRTASRDAVAAVHDELDSAFADVQLGTPRKCSVGASVNCQDFPSAPRELGVARLYREGSSRLDRILTRTTAPAQIDPNAPPAPDLLDDAQLSVIVTDGMQASTDAGEDAETCAQGADPGCIASLLRKRTEEGFGLWLVASLLGFDGKHFPERTLTDAYLQQARKHVDQLKFDTKNLGVDFKLKGTALQEAGNGHSSYVYQGYKPLLFLVLSRDATLGRRFVASLARKLMAAPLQPGKMKPEDAVRSLEIAPLDTGVHATEVVALSREQQVKQGIRPEFIAEFRLDGTHRDGALVSSKVWCGGNGRGLLHVQHERTEPGLLPAFLREDVTLRLVSQPPATAVAPPVTASANSIRTGLNCSVLPRGRTTMLFSLDTTLALDEMAAQHEWWGRQGWSSQNTWEMPERLYGIEDVVLSILKPRTGRPAPRSDVRVHAQRD